MAEGETVEAGQRVLAVREGEDEAGADEEGRGDDEATDRDAAERGDNEDGRRGGGRGEDGGDDEGGSDRQARGSDGGEDEGEGRDDDGRGARDGGEGGERARGGAGGRSDDSGAGDESGGGGSRGGGPGDESGGGSSRGGRAGGRSSGGGSRGAGGKSDDRRTRGKSDDGGADRAPRDAAGGGERRPGAPGPPCGAPLAAPSVRQLARELGVAIEDVPGTGADGRVEADDVKSYVRRTLEDLHARVPDRPALPDLAAYGEHRREPLGAVRRAIADGVARSWREVPHVTQDDVADVTALRQFRRRAAEEIEAEGGRLTLTAIVLAVVARALHQFPRFNAAIDLDRGLGALADRRGVRHLRGRARFVDGERVAVGDDTLTFGRCILATGSAPVRLPMLPDSLRVWDSAAALALESIPSNLLVIGGGYIGLEMATVYAALGADVAVVEATDGLLPGVDRALVKPMAEMLADRGVDLRTGTTVEDAREDGEGLDVTVRGPDGAETLRAERVLVAVGRVPLTDGLDLHRTRVEDGPDGFVRVDAQQRATDRRIFAIGDVAGEPMLAHKASHEGRVAAEVAAGGRAAFDARAIPAVVFTDPAIAWCGLTETDAAARGVDVRVASFPWTASGRAVTLDRTEGLTRVLLDPETRRVLGVGLVGVHAGELIAEAALALEMGATADDLARTIHPHPTLSETLAEAAEQASGGSPHRAPPRGR